MTRPVTVGKRGRCALAAAAHTIIGFPILLKGIHPDLNPGYSGHGLFWQTCARATANERAVPEDFTRRIAPLILLI